MFLRKPRFFFNADSNAGSGDASDDKPNSDGAADATKPNDDSDVDWKERFELTKSERDAAKREARKVKERLAALESQLTERERKEAQDKGDLPKLRESFQKEKEAIEAEKQTLLNELNDAAKRDAFMRNAGLFVDKSVEQVWKLIKDDLEIQIEDGKRVVVVKDSALPVGDYLKRFADEHDYFAKNPGKPGTGANGAGKGSNGKAASIPNDFNTWSYERKKEWMRDNPELAAQAASKALGM